MLARLKRSTTLKLVPAQNVHPIPFFPNVPIAIYVMLQNTLATVSHTALEESSAFV